MREGSNSKEFAPRFWFSDIWSRVIFQFFPRISSLSDMDRMIGAAWMALSVQTHILLEQTVPWKYVMQQTGCFVPQSMWESQLQPSVCVFGTHFGSRSPAQLKIVITLIELQAYTWWKEMWIWTYRCTIKGLLFSQSFGCLLLKRVIPAPWQMLYEVKGISPVHVVLIR